MSEAMARASRLLPSRLRAIGNWPVWSLPGWLTAFVLAVVVADLAAIGVAARAVTFSGHDLGLFCLLLGCTAIAVELTRNAGEQGGVMPAELKRSVEEISSIASDRQPALV